MKNFTNNFKQFTSRLSARWLIIALMMLVGTSSAWGKTYIAGSFNGWSTNNEEYELKNNTLTIILGKGNYEYKRVIDGSWENGGNRSLKINDSDYYLVTFNNDGTNVASKQFSQAAGTFYYDATNTPGVINNGTCYFMIGKNDHVSRTTLNRVAGTQYLFKGSVSKYDGALGWYVFYQNTSYTENINKWAHSGDNTSTHTYTSAFTSNKIYSGKSSSSNATAEKKSPKRYEWNSSQTTHTTYKVTINSVEGGTLTVKDFDNATVSNGTSKSILTVLKFSATPSDGYDFTEVQIDNGSTTTTISKADLTTKTYTLTSNVTITPVWESACAKSATEGKGSFSDGTIKLSAKFNTCGNAYIGFQWKKQDDIDWCYTNDGTEECYKALGEKNKSNAVEETSFTKINNEPLSGSYVFRPYIVDGSDATKWIYGDDFEVSTCSDPSTGYTISNENASVDWDGTEKEVIITTANGYATPSKIYYERNETKPTAVGEYTITIDVPSNGTYCAATKLEIGTFTITCPSIAAPAITTSATVCAGTQVTLSNYNGVNDNTVKWYSDEECNSEVTEQVTLTDNDTKYYAKAYHAASGCYSSEYSTLTFTVNPLPTISISGNNSAVLYEDVELTAATDGTSISWEITEGDGSLSSTTGNSVTLTSSSVGTVTVTAKAFLNGCESAEASHPVTFSAEDCNDVVVYDNENVEIWLSSSLDKTMYLHRWYENGNQDTDITTWPGANTTKSDGYYKWTTTSSGNIGYIFHDNSSTNKSSDANKTLEKGYRYYFTFNGGTGSATFNKSERITTTTPAPISAPAAKTISVSTTDGEGNIIFSGQVVKTGCDATNEYGFQYSSDEQTWTTVKVGENAAAGTVISNNTVTGLDGTYYVRAYITNDNSTQYGAVTEITVSTEKDPITTVTLTHVKNQAGESYSDQELENLTYCVGDIVWFKLEQDGSNFQEYKWISYPGTELRGMYTGGMFQFKITKSGDVGIRLRNDANVDGEGNPTWVESNLLEFNTHPEPTAPTIRFATATICSNDNEGATLKLGATVSGQAYELWKYENDDDTEGSKVANVATLNCTENNQELQFTGIKTAGKYFVKTYYTAFCNTVTANSSYATLTVVNAKDVSISITPATATTTPWMPVKLTISATDDYTLEVPDGVEFSQKGDICSVKIPLPQGANGGEGQYENVSFPQDATTSYIVTAKLVSTGGEDNPCAVPATATITLTPYVEECTIGH